MSIITVQALRSVQNGQILFQVAIPASQTKQLNIKFERFDPSLVNLVVTGAISKEDYLEKQGYQRPLDKNRVNRFKTYVMSKDAISPTVLLVNDRSGDCKFDENTGILKIPSNSPLYVYDGQHRGEGFWKALEENVGLNDFPILMVITSKLPKLKEMGQFKVINNTAKSMKTDLVVEIMTTVQVDSADSQKDAKDIACMHAIHFLNFGDESPLKNMIIVASQRKPTKQELDADEGLRHQRIIPCAPFMRSLRDVHVYFEGNQWFSVQNGTLKTPAALEARGEKIAEVTVEFWKAVKSQMPETFDHPDDYLLLSPNGIQAMHRVLVYLLAGMHLGRRKWKSKEFVTMTNKSEWFTDESLWKKESGKAATFDAGIPGMERLRTTIIESLKSPVE